jgi:hypothetical protein
MDYANTPSWTCSRESIAWLSRAAIKSSALASLPCKSKEFPKTSPFKIVLPLVTVTIDVKFRFLPVDSNYSPILYRENTFFNAF